MKFDNKLKPKQIPMKLYHGSDNVFKTPDPTRSFGGAYGEGFYTTTDPEETKGYGNHLYEYDFGGGNFFDPDSFTLTPDQQKIIKEDYIKHVLKEHFWSKSKKNKATKNIDSVMEKNHFNKEGKIKSGADFIDMIRWISQNSDIRPYLKKLGVNTEALQGIRRKITPEKSHYVVFDPKTLKLRTLDKDPQTLNYIGDTPKNK